MGIFGESSSASIAGFILIGVSFLLQLIGFATPFWIYGSVGGSKVHSGLWQTCGSVAGTTTCLKPCDLGCSSSFKGAQATATLGFVVLLAATVCATLKMFVLKDKTIVKMAGVCCCFLGGVFALVGAIVYATQGGVPTSNLHFSFAFSIIAGVGGLLSGILIIVGK